MSAPPAPQHRILRQVIELQGGRRAQAQALQNAALVLFRRDWLPVIERLCSALGDDQTIQRIDRLEITLSPVPAGWLLGQGDAAVAAAQDVAGQAAEDSTAWFEAALAPRLAQALQAATEVQADLELMAHALHGGMLPWWADPADREALRRAALALLDGPTSAWRSLLGRPCSDDAGLRRLVAGLDEALLGRLLGRLLADPGQAPAWPAELNHAWSQALAGSAAGLGLPVARLQAAWWCEALSTALQGGSAVAAGPQPQPVTWLPAVLDRLAHRLWLDAGRLPQALRRALDEVSGTDQPQRLAPLWAALAACTAAATGSATHGTRADGAAEADLAQRLAALAAREAQAWRQGPQAAAGPAAPAAAWWRALQAGLAGAPAGLRSRLALALQAAPGADPLALGTALQALLEQAARQPGWPAALQPAATGLAWPAVAAQLAPALQAQAKPVPAMPRLQPGAVDSVQVGNAGLVLLAPFLPRFAQRLGLRDDDGGWCDAAAPWRVARLLQYLASGDGDAPDFQLPLNKLLCGLPLDAVPERLDPVADDDRVEAEALLRAVIGQAPVLRNMSSDGFRGSFLLRSGQLSARDGHWLLRVERQAWDLVLERFPWSVGLVRLPWMPTLLQVQW